MTQQHKNQSWLEKFALKYVKNKILKYLFKVFVGGIVAYWAFAGLMLLTLTYQEETTNVFYSENGPLIAIELSTKVIVLCVLVLVFLILGKHHGVGYLLIYSGLSQIVFTMVALNQGKLNYQELSILNNIIIPTGVMIFGVVYIYIFKLLSKAGS